MAATATYIKQKVIERPIRLVALRDVAWTDERLSLTAFIDNLPVVHCSRTPASHSVCLDIGVAVDADIQHKTTQRRRDLPCQ